MLTRPILLAMTAFDATEQRTFSFVVPDADTQIVANQLTIRDQESNIIVYQNIQNTFKYEHIVPANTLVNGTYYNATISVLDAQGKQSVQSLAIQFSCYTKPSVELTNIPTGSIINNASFNFTFTYNQSESERLNSYIVNLYNSSKILISTSKPVYVQDGTSPYNGSYLFTGFEDNTIYYIEVVCETVNGMIAKTIQEQIIIKYKKPNLFTLVELKNNCDEGYISITSNILLIDGESYPVPPVYIDSTEIDLRKAGHYVEWNDGYIINGDFCARAWFRDPKLGKIITQFSNASGQTIKIRYMNGYENVDAINQQAYIEVFVESVQGQAYYIFSNYIPILPSSDYYVLQFRRINDIYQVELVAK